MGAKPAEMRKNGPSGGKMGAKRAEMRKNDKSGGKSGAKLAWGGVGGSYPPYKRKRQG